jgi:hypothetical protein
MENSNKEIKMKRFAISTLLALLLTGLCFGYGQAQTFVGLSWEGNPGIVIGGKIIPLTDKLNTFGYARLSVDSASYDNGLKTQQALAAELTYHLIDKLNQDFYLIGGASCDWANTGVDKSLTTYFTESVGGLFTTRTPFLDKIPLLNTVFEEPGLWFAGKFRPQLFDSGTKWQDKFVLGFGIKSGI